MNGTYRVLLAAVAALVAGCLPGVPLGEQCYFGCVQECSDTASGRVCTCRPTIRGCADDLYCSLTTNNCEVPSQRGEPCGEQCAEGLICRFDGLCGELSLEGETCAQDVHCVTGLHCNWGGVAFTRTSIGRCMPVQGEGGPCSWTHVATRFGAVANEEYHLQATRNCGPDLICQPDAHGPDPSTLTVETATRHCDGRLCAYPGKCVRPGRAELGDVCVDSRTCKSARCYVPAEPRVEDPALRALCVENPLEVTGDDPNCFLAPVTGTCISQDTPIHNEACGAEGTPPCPRGLACGGNRCYARFREGDFGVCGYSDEAPLFPEACGIGLSCQFNDGYWRCIAP